MPLMQNELLDTILADPTTTREEELQAYEQAKNDSLILEGIMAMSAIAHINIKL
jgi:hypothetical protein